MALPALAACPPVSTDLPDEPAAREAALRQLDESAESCTNDAAWFAQRGALLLAGGRLAEAAESLERAILLAPDHAGARIDYADALAGLGDYPAAKELARSLLTLSSLPPPARQHLEARLHSWESLPYEKPPVWQLGMELGLHLGWESNLNGAPAADTTLLTLPDGPVRLALATRPRQGAAAVFDTQGQALRPLPSDWFFMLHARARLRDSPAGESDYALGQFDASLMKRLPDGDLALQFARIDQQFGGVHLLAENRLVAQYLWKAEGCRPRLGMDAVQREYPTLGELDGHQLGLRVGLNCTSGSWSLDGDLRLARDHPQSSDRPGGAQRWDELQINGGWRGARHAIKLEASLGSVRDTDGYSPLLQYNAERHIRRSALRLELVRPVGTHWEGVASIEYFRQQSNIGLFELNNLGLYFGARYRY